MFIYGFTCKDLNVKSLASLFQPHCILMNKKCVTDNYTLRFSFTTFDTSQEVDDACVMLWNNIIYMHTPAECSL